MRAPHAGGGTAEGQVWVQRLVLTHFRCYAHAEIEADARPVVLTGPNGAGKTNLIEAISFLAPGRGLRRSRLGEVERRVSGGPVEAGPRAAGAWAVAARLATPAGPLDIGTGRAAATAVPETAAAVATRRVVKVDGAFVRSQDALAERLSVVWLTPQMDRLFSEGPGGRRRFLDRLVLALDPAHGARVAAFEHAARERARVLEEALLENRTADGAWLAGIEEQIAGLSVAIVAARADLVRRLGETSRPSGAFPRPILRLTGPVEAWLAAMPALAAEDRLREELAQSRALVARGGGASLPGAQRGDLEVTMAANGMAAASVSTGEQKALLIAIILAHARLIAGVRGSAPILLLDEVAAHLDAGRRRALFEELLALAAQAWMTGTDAALFEELGARAQHVSVRDATLVPS